MSPPSAFFRPRRTELILSPLGDKGQHVVKDPLSGEYFQVGAQEAFLLSLLDGKHSVEEICGAFEARFNEPFTREDLEGFLELAQSQGFLQPEKSPASPLPDVLQDAPPAEAPSPANVAKKDQSILYWRKNIFDPDRLFNWLQPKLWFFWTRTFLIVSLCGIALAVSLVWANRHELISHFAQVFRWETALLAGLTLLTVTACHEFAHGLTCKRYGGEVHEIGFLLLFFMPCFYCNVSDAWLFREKSKRMWVTLAGGYFELFLWALAVFVWRMTVQDNLINYLAFVVMMVSGSRVFFNFNPLLKLDGYYLLSDFIEVPNLQQRGLRSVTDHARWLLWGARRPAREPRGRLILAYGLASWIFSVTFLSVLVVALGTFLGSFLGWLGMALALTGGFLLMRGFFSGWLEGEVKQMLQTRHKRTLIWLGALAGAAAILFLIEVEDRASGPFQVRAVTRAEVRAPVAGFLQTVYRDESERVSAGLVIAHLDIPDLGSRLAQKQAEVREAEAKLRLLEAGARPREIAEQRSRLDRARSWQELAEKELVKLQEAFQAELVQLDKRAAEHVADVASARKTFHRITDLLKQKGASEEELQLAERKYLVAKAQLEQVHAQKRVRQAIGTLQAETELERRKNELADSQAKLALLLDGARREEIDAQRAHLSRLQEEARYLETLQQKLSIHSPVAGIITAPSLKESVAGKRTHLRDRLRDKVGTYLREGDLICEVEEPSDVRMEISLAEQDAARVQVGQTVELKARAFPFQTFVGRVDRIETRAQPGEVHSTVTAYCRLETPAPNLLPGMTGHARVYAESRSIGGIVLDRILRFARTEFW